MSVCAIDGCDGTVIARGWCSKHYQRWQHHSDPLAVCLPPGPPSPFKSGDRLGRLTIIEEAPRVRNGRDWRCRCDCGNEIIVGGRSLQQGRTRSCGCLRRELTVSRNQGRATHGHTAGPKPTPTFNSWSSMRDRCRLKTASAYPQYGGRGITVCERWANSFENFLADMGERPDGKTLDRIDPFGNYEPGNCQWSTPIEQARNRRKTEEIIMLIDRYEGALLRIRNGADNPQTVAAAALTITAS